MNGEPTDQRRIGEQGAGRVPAFDHTAFAVADAVGWSERLRRQLGATPIVGEALPEFRYLLLHVGSAEAGARLELLEPVGDGFLTRYLRRHGEGAHHLTFIVANLTETVRRVVELGFTVVGENLANPAWQEAFIAPEPVHGTVILLAQTDRTYPEPAELLSTRARDPATMPTVGTAPDQEWWSRVWAAEPERRAELTATRLGSGDEATSLRLFRDVLGAEVDVGPTGSRFSWPGGSLLVRPSDQPGITGLLMTGGVGEDISIGGVPLTNE